MIPETLKRVQVWSGGLRLAHWAMAFAVLILLATGWLFARDLLGSRRAALIGLHVGMGYVLMAALAFRLYRLGLGTGADRWRDFTAQIGARATGAMLRFYLTGGRAPLPAYYAHNPLWAPLYLLLFAVLVLQVCTGTLLNLMYYQEGALTAYAWLYELPMNEIHRWGYRLIGGFTLLHIAAVMLHDWRGRGAEISAMLSGDKVFSVRELPKGALAQVGAVSGKPATKKR